MVAPAPGHIDPVLGDFPQISKSARIATMGSCFAQHISASLSHGGYNYYVAETARRHLKRRCEKAKLRSFFRMLWKCIHGKASFAVIPAILWR